MRDIADIDRMERTECDDPAGAVDRWSPAVFHPLVAAIGAHPGGPICSDVNYENVP